VLRQAAVCHADSSLQTFKWDINKSKPAFDPETPYVRSCVDWAALIKSMEHRVVVGDEMERLENTLLDDTE
jgi:hypothetical protein